MKPHILSLLIVSALLAGCVGSPFARRSPATQKALAEELEALKLQKVISFATLQVRKRRYRYALAILQPHEKHPSFGRQIQLMLKEIKYRIETPNIETEKELSARLGIRETQEKMILPENYGVWTPLRPQLGPFNLAKGPMEKLLDKRVTMKMTKVPVRELLIRLSEMDGLNLIADDDLTGLDKEVTVNVNEDMKVPLRYLLAFIERNTAIRFIIGERAIWATQGEDENLGPQLDMRVITLRKGYTPNSGAGGKNTDAKGTDDLETALSAFLYGDDADNKPDKAKFFIYRNQNVLVIRDTRERIRMAQRIVAKLDRDPLQVEIEARFLTFSQSDLKQLGTSINRIERQGSKNILSGSSLLPAFGQTIGGSPMVNLQGVLGRGGYDVTLSLLEKLGLSKTLTAPRLTVLNGEVASMHRGDIRYYYEEYDFEIGDRLYAGDDDDDDDNIPDVVLVPRGPPKKLETGVKFEATPSIGNDGKSIRLDLHASIKDFIEFESLAAGVSLPRTNNSQIDTKAIVSSGDTLILGGQIRASENDSESRVPFLGRVPLIGWLFKKKEVSREPLHLMIFVTATIVDPDGSYKFPTEPLIEADRLDGGEEEE